jgi:hypothetical protein
MNRLAKMTLGLFVMASMAVGSFVLLNRPNPPPTAPAARVEATTRLEPAPSPATDLDEAAGVESVDEYGPLLGKRLQRLAEYGPLLGQRLQRLAERGPARHGQAKPAKPEAANQPKTPDPDLATLDTSPPPLRILAPKGHAVTMNPKLILRVKSEPGALVTVDGEALAEHSPGLFAKDLRLQPGRNKLLVLAMDENGNRAHREVLATYAAPARIEDRKDRFLSLMDQLDEIQTAATEIDRRIAELISQMDTPGNNEDKVAALSKELRTIRNTRREIKHEVKKAIAEIDAMLVRNK